MVIEAPARTQTRSTVSQTAFRYLRKLLQVYYMHALRVAKMQIFLSHNSRQKPLVREIKNCLPEHLNLWIDEEKLLIGDDIANSIESTIRTETDYVLLFIDEHAASSDWVRREIDWTIQAERRHRRTILLSIVLDQAAVSRLDMFEIQQRKHLHLRDFSERSVRALAESISSELFALICRDTHRLGDPKPKSASDKISDAEKLLKSQAALVQKAVFPHRSANPISTEQALTVINSQSTETLSPEEFETILSSIVHRNMIPGLSYDGSELFLVEEHASWKSEVQKQKKEAIARKAVGAIHNGKSVLIDAGSTSQEIVKLLCKRIENRLITKLTVATPSVKIADLISDCCVKMGFDDDFSAVQLFIPGGRVRPNTQAIVADKNGLARQIPTLSNLVGGFDLCFVGVNGVDEQAGFTTHGSAEAANKIEMLSAARERFIVGDSSKVGIALEHKIARLNSDVTFVVDNDPQNVALQEIIAKGTQRMLFA